MGLNYGNGKLLDKFNLSLSCLDYIYIDNSTNVKELENILLILRSGEEGFYPDLIKFCECRLSKLSPGNKLLDVTKPISSLKDLPREDQEFLNSDLKDWVEGIKLQDNELAMAPARTGFESNCPIRNDKVKTKTETKEIMKNAEDISRPKTTLSYNEWDKFDAEKEIEKLEQEQPIEEKLQESLQKMYGGDVLPIVDVSGLTDSEKIEVADKEKMKGNEYFKAQNYVESLIYYSRSLSAWETVAALNNRAFAYMKLKNYSSAIADFDQVLELEPDNVKALYRRGSCYKETGSLQLAYMDFQNALELDPSCKEAKKELEKVDKCPVLKTSTAKSPIIEEVQDSPALDFLTTSEKKRKVAIDMDSQLKAKRTIYYDKKHSPMPSSLDVDNTNNSDDQLAGKSDVASEKIQSPDKTECPRDEHHKSDDLLGASGDTHLSLNATESKNAAAQDEGNKYVNAVPLPVKMTPFKFLNVWHTTKANKDSKAGAEILNSIIPENLPIYITNKMDADLLNGLIMAIKEIVNSGDWMKGYSFLKYITDIPRISIILSFLSSSERSEIENILVEIEAKQKAEMKIIKETLLSS